MCHSTLITACLVVVAGSLELGCSGSGAEKPKQAESSATTAPSVGTTDAQLRPIAQRLTVSSELVPFQEIDVYAKEAGYVKDLNVDYGSRVRRGQVMAVLEIPELEAQLKEDQAIIKARQDEVTRAQQEVGRAKAQADVSRLQYDRLQGVAKTKPGLVAQQEVDDAQGKDLAAASNLDAVKGSLSAAQSEVEVARAKLARDQTLFDYAKITAPFDGVVTQRYANLGALMQAGTSSTQATPLVRLSQENVYRLVIPVPESYVRYIRIGDPVEVKVPSLGETDQGKVARFSADVNSTTRTMHTEVNVENRKGTLVPGLYAEAILTLNHAGSVVTVPIQAIDRTDEQTSVMILHDDNTVERRRVTLGIQTANFAEVSNGLSAGDHVVLSDRSGLRAGEHVMPHRTEVLAYDSANDGDKE